MTSGQFKIEPGSQITGGSSAPKSLRAAYPSGSEGMAR